MELAIQIKLLQENPMLADSYFKPIVVWSGSQGSIMIKLNPVKIGKHMIEMSYLINEQHEFSFLV